MKVSYTNYICDWEGCEANQFVPAHEQMEPNKWTFLKLWTVGDSPDVGWDKCFCPLHGNLVRENVDRGIK